MQVGQFGSLRDFAAKAPVQDGAYADTIRQKGQDIIQQALTTYSSPQWSQKAGDVAVNDLADLERAIKVVVDRTKGETAANSQQIDSLVSGLNQTGVADGRLKAAALVHISNPAEAALPDHSDRISNYSSLDGLTSGQLNYAQETAGAVRPAVDKMEGLAAFIKDLHGVAGLYAAAVAAGPPTLNLGNFAREESGAAVHQESSSSSSGSSSDRAAYGLGIGGIRFAHSSMSGSTQSSTDGHFASDKTSTDERIVPMIRDLIERLDQASVYPAQHATVNGYQVVTGTRTDMKEDKRDSSWWKPTTWFKDDAHAAHPVVSDLSWNGLAEYPKGTYSITWSSTPVVARPIASEAYEPSHLKLPLTGVSNYDAK